MQSEQRYKKARMITLLGALANLGLGFIKIIAGTLFHSHALIADGLHSFSDLVIDGMVLFAAKYSSQDADDTHPYGHQRIETATTLFLALILILTGAGVIWDSIHELLTSKTTQPGLLSFPVALFSVLINEGLFYYTRHVGHALNSPLIIANAWHHRSDAAASVVVLIGLLGSLFGAPVLDPIAAVFVGCIIIKMGINYGWNSVKELVDTAIEPKMLSSIDDLIRNIPGVVKIHQLRTRTMGQDIFVDVHVIVAPFISVSEGHYIAQTVHQTLCKDIPSVKDVTVHIDPEDDELIDTLVKLPNRPQLEVSLIDRWKQLFPIQSWTIHYNNNHVLLDLVLEKSPDECEQLEQNIRQDLKHQPIINAVRVFSFYKTYVI